jgi:tRNA 2-thiocytidine biosynthesis protein TtcA
MGELERLRKRIASEVGTAITRFELIEEGDHILVCLSGGKDSYTLLDMLMRMQRRAPVDFKLTAFHLDQKQPGYPEGILREYLEGVEIPFEIAEEDTYSVVREKLAKDATPCSLCSRLRRGIIYSRAEALGCNKIALGHHRDDSVETLLLNLFHSGQLQGMPARYKTDDGRFDVIRPLIFVAEEEIRRYAELREFPIIPCNLCGSIEGQRKFIRRTLDELEETIPHIRNSVLAAMKNVRRSHLLDESLWDPVAGSAVDGGVESGTARPVVEDRLF